LKSQITLNHLPDLKSFCLATAQHFQEYEKLVWKMKAVWPSVI